MHFYLAVYMRESQDTLKVAIEDEGFFDSLYNQFFFHLGPEGNLQRFNFVVSYLEREIIYY